MRFRSGNTQLRNGLAFMTARENSPSDHLYEIVPEKRPSLLESEAVHCGRVDGWATTCPQSWDLLNREIRVATCAVTRYTSKWRGRFHERGSGVILIPCGRPRSWEGNATSQTTRERASASVDRNAFDPSVNGGVDPRRERNRAYMICLAYTIDNRPVVLLPERPRIKTREQAFDLGAVS
jgi:hypothetical protein